MSSETAICNLAIGHLGISKEIGNVDTERSAQAQICRRFYDPARREVFRDFNWSFANVYIAVDLVESEPNTNWLFSYRYPSNCRRVKKILSGIRSDTEDTIVPYEIGSDSVGLLIFTDMEDAILQYTKEVTNVALFPGDFIMAFSFLLASYIAPSITGGDPFKLGERAFQLYLASVNKAEASNFNEQQDDKPNEAESIRARS